MLCAQCERDVPDGAFCTVCGARQGSGESGGGGKGLDRFAAAPGESLVSPTSIFSTLFPHLGHNEVNEFKWVFVGGIVVLAVLSLLGLLTAAILLSAFLVPVLYLMYLYEVRIYRDAPIPVVGLTIGGGLLLGVVVTLIANQLVVSLVDIQVTPFGTILDLPTLLAGAVLVPLVAEVVKPIPALLLHGRKDIPETVDGLVLGVAAGLGFSAAATIVNFAGILTGSGINTAVAGWVYPLISLAIFAPLMAGSTTGLITAALWRRLGHGTFGRLELGGVALALVMAVLFVLGDRIVAGFGLPGLLGLAWQFVAVAIVVVYLRIVLHAALVEEAGTAGLAYTTCPNCRTDIIAAGFCPSCGMALGAAPASVRDARVGTEPDGKVGA